ncbi:MAG: SufD family Fe-S cluster assembly protein [Bacteroidetes bacterium]|nr:SufD family Fe-S cluster assembly protein [Bacteroidota bacterium]
MDIKEKILKEINKNKQSILGPFALLDEYEKIFQKMDTIKYDNEYFKVYPKDFFEDFNYEIYNEDYNIAINSFKNIDDILSQITENANIIFSINGYFSEKHSKIISKNIDVISITNKQYYDYLQIKKQFVEFYYGENETQISILNNLLSKNGIYINIANNSIIEFPIYLLNIITELPDNYFVNSKKLIKVGKNSNANIIEIGLIFSKFDTIYSESYSIYLKENANVNYSKVYFDSNNLTNKTSYLKNCNYKLDKNSNLNMNSITLGRNYNKNDTLIKLEGDNATLNDTYFILSNNDKVVDLNTTIQHKALNTKSNQLVKVVANDNSKMYFDGKIIIKENAEQSSATQNSKAILLSDNAQVQFQPQLEIYNDDIKATHGSAIGNLDSDLLFYLKTRCIDEDTAKKLLLVAFANDIIEHSSINDEFKNNVINLIINDIN